VSILLALIHPENYGVSQKFYIPKVSWQYTIRQKKEPVFICVHLFFVGAEL